MRFISQLHDIFFPPTRASLYNELDEIHSKQNVEWSDLVKAKIAMELGQVEMRLLDGGDEELMILDFATRVKEILTC